MKTLIIAVAMTAFMGNSVAFAEEVAVPAEQVAQANEVSAFEGVETIALSSEEMNTMAGRSINDWLSKTIMELGMTFR